MNTETPNTAPTKTPSLVDDYVMKLEAQGKEWDAQIALWSAKAGTVSADVTAELHTWQREFRDLRDGAQKKLEVLRAANQEAWVEMKTGVEAAWNDVKDAVDAARSKFS